MALPAFVLPAILGAAGGYAASKIGDKGGGSGYTQVANRFGELEQPLKDFYLDKIGKPGPTYPGGAEGAVAPMSEQEKLSLGFLQDYGNKSFGQTYTNAQDQINKTLTNQFDPTTSPYYQAVKAESARNLEDTQRNIKNNSAGGGRYYTGARVATQGEAAADTKTQLDVIMGALADKERDRAISVIPQALQFEQAAMNQPLQKATAFQTLGGLPRSIEQAMKSFDVGQWQQSEVDYPMNIASMVSSLLSNNQPVLQQNQPSGISQLMGGVGQTAGNVGTTLLMASLFGLI